MLFQIKLKDSLFTQMWTLTKKERDVIKTELNYNKYILKMTCVYENCMQSKG